MKMFKFILLVSLLLVMASCQRVGSGSSNQNSELSGVYTHEDSKNGVVCYQTSHHNLSCVKVK